MSTLTFNQVCLLLEDIEKISTRQPRLEPEKEKKKVQKIISTWFSTHRQAIDNPATNGGAVLSALLPHRRKDRVYGLQAKSLSKKIINLLNPNFEQRKPLEEWESGKHGDLGACTEKALKRYDGTFRIKPAFPIERIDRLLTQLAAKYRYSDAALRRQRDVDFDTDSELKNILSRLFSWEAKWLAKLILREYCTIHLNENYIFRKYHFLLPDLLQFQNDFDAVFSMLREELGQYPSAPNPNLERAMRMEASKKLKAKVGIKVARPNFYKAWSFKNLFQLTGDQAWAAEVKYDGEYCEIHVDLDKGLDDIQIFSKNGKDATDDREKPKSTIRQALRIGREGCLFKKKCIVLGELVIYSDKEQKILPFSKIRKHVKRSGTVLGAMQDSLPHDWEHVMIVFFDVLVIDEKQILREELQTRRDILRELIQPIPGHAARSEWSVVDFGNPEDGKTDLKQAFARALAHHEEGLVLKPLHSPYFPLVSGSNHCTPGYFIKLKKDYLADMGGERDLGDFAVIGGSFDSQVAAKFDMRPLHWTHFHLGCLTNKDAVERLNSKPQFKVVGTLSMDMCIPKSDAKFLNTHGRLWEILLSEDADKVPFDIKHSLGFGPKMTSAFKTPFIVEILGGGYEKVQNETFEMLRHPRVKKIHQDRTWKDEGTVTMEDLKRMAGEKWKVPDPDNLDGHAKDVALLVIETVRKLNGSQITASEFETTQETTQRTTQRSSQETPRPGVVARSSQGSLMSSVAHQSTQETSRSRASIVQESQEGTQETPRPGVVDESQEGIQATLQSAVFEPFPEEPDKGDEVPETQQMTQSTTSATQLSHGTQGKGVRASREFRFLVREDTSERLARISPPKPARNDGLAFPTPQITSTPSGFSSHKILTLPISSAPSAFSSNKKRPLDAEDPSPPPSKRHRKALTSLQAPGTNRNLGFFEHDSQEKVIHVYAEEGWTVKVHEE